MFTKPTLILNERICRANIEFMLAKARKLGIELRPHFKTHQSIEVGKWFRDYGIGKIAVSSVPMAQYFASDGWNDITIAFPYVHQQAEEINALAKSINLQVLVSSIGNAKLLSKSIETHVEVYIEIDTGQYRSGLQIEDIETVNKTIEVIQSNPNTKFYGFLSHAGHSYNNQLNRIEQINSEATGKLNRLKKNYIEQFPNLKISYGDTPTSCACNQFDGIDELRPGNYAFFDMQQASNGICSTSNIAIALICPVVAVYPERSQAIIWGGAVHLTKDFYVDNQGNKSFGAVCKINPDYTWTKPIEGMYLESISQEHGLVRAQNCEAIRTLKEGDLIAVLPPHSCLTADKMGEFWVQGKGFISMMNHCK
ncbi:MAG: alanine racemase [Bacteroidales bacterium]|nr:alanine racemase [Bacteroidales bacterium]